MIVYLQKVDFHSQLGNRVQLLGYISILIQIDEQTEIVINFCSIICKHIKEIMYTQVEN